MSTHSPNSNVVPTSPASAVAVGKTPLRRAGSAQTPGTPTSPAQPMLPSIKFNKQLLSMVHKAEAKPELIRGVAALLKAAGCDALWIVTKEGDKHSQPISLLGDDSAIAPLLDNGLATTAGLVEANKSLVTFEPPAMIGSILLGAPISAGDTTTDILIGLFPTSRQSPVPFDWAFNLGADAVSKWQIQRFVSATNYQLSSLSSFVNMAAAMNRTSNRLDASITLVNELKNAANCGHVALILRDGSNSAFRLTAMSGVEFFDRNAATTQTIESTILGIEEEPIFWSRKQTDSTDDGQPKVNLQNFCDLFAAPGCALLPLRNSQEQLFGWLVLSLTEEQDGNAQTEKHFRQINSLVSGQLETVLKSQRTMTRVCLDNTRQVLKQNLVKKLSILALVATIALCIPFAYKINCDCELQLTSRRFVAAPYEGLLEKTLVDSGDIVTKGQTLARMDASQLRMELSGFRANLESERKKRDSALARGSVAESQIARAEMSRLESEIAIINHRLQDTEIRSPVDGVIVSGDLDKAEGAPMEMGQNLFEVGPLEQMLVEVQIPENEIQYARPGMEVQFEFDAFPFETFAGTIERIHPRAEVIGSDSVFVAEINLDNSDGQLRPGLKGRARISGDHSPLGWNLFHGAYEKARQWLIW